MSATTTTPQGNRDVTVADLRGPISAYNRRYVTHIVKGRMILDADDNLTIGVAKTDLRAGRVFAGEIR